MTLFAYRIRPDWDGRSLLHFDRALDALLDRTAREMDVVRWRTHVREIGRRFRTHLPAIPLLFRQTVSVRPRNLAGWQPTGTTTPVTATAEDWRWVDDPTGAVVP